MKSLWNETLWWCGDPLEPQVWDGVPLAFAGQVGAAKDSLCCLAAGQR